MALCLQGHRIGTSEWSRGGAVCVVLPAARGRKAGGAYFDPATIRIQWKQTL